MLDQGHLDLSSFYLDALDETGDTRVGREQIPPLLMGHARPQMDVSRYERGLATGELFELNWDQSEALAQAYATDLAWLVQGPPGTGKTRVLAHLARALVEDGERVLSRRSPTAPSTISSTRWSSRPRRPGRQDRAAQPGRRPAERRELRSLQASPMAEMSAGYVIGATPFATRTKRLRGVEFDTVIFDEASQITLPLAVMGMLAGKKFIFIGDQRQLPPVIASGFSRRVHPRVRLRGPGRARFRSPC